MNVNLKMLAGQFIGVFLLFALALFLPAGTLTWLAGWTFLGMFFTFMLLVNLWLLRHNPGLLQERMRGRADNQQGWDKVLFPALLIGFFAWLSGMGLEVERLHWSHVPFLLQVVGGIILLGSFYLLFLTFATLILVLAANTSFAAFPRLTAILARAIVRPVEQRHPGGPEMADGSRTGAQRGQKKPAIGGGQRHVIADRLGSQRRDG